MRRLAVIAGLVAALVPATGASAAVRTFPGPCGATLTDCINAAPSGATIRLRTNNLIAIPDSFISAKPLKFEAAKGFKPKIGRNGPVTAQLRFSIMGPKGGVWFRGITFRQVNIVVTYSVGSHHTVFEGNTVRLNSGSSGDSGFFLSYGTVAVGPITIRDNDISASGVGLYVYAQGGTATIVGNTVTSPRVGDSSVGILFSASAANVKAVIANNLVHHVSDCNCGTATGIVVVTSDLATLNAWVVNNTVADIGNNLSDPFRGIVIRSPSMAPGRANVRVYNNVVSGATTGIYLEAGSRLEVTGDRNDVFASPQPTFLNSHQIGTTLHKNPRFKNANGPNYRLKGSSALSNAAEPCVPGLALPREDAAGRFRYFGRSLDIGAFERGSTAKGSAKGVSKTGTKRANRLRGTNGRDVLCGFAGNDKLFGLGGPDNLFGGLGKDEVFGGDGNDRIDVHDGAKGNDSADGGPGQNVCLTDANDRRVSC
jgi:hypothetical protein